MTPLQSHRSSPTRPPNPGYLDSEQKLLTLSLDRDILQREGGRSLNPSPDTNIKKGAAKKE